MSAAALLATASLMLALAALAEIRRAAAARSNDGGEGEGRSAPVLRGPAAELVERLRLRSRVARAGLEGRLELPVLLAAKLACAVAGAGFGALVAPAAPGRLSLLVALGLPAAGFLAPDAMLERRARIRLRRLRGSLPDALDLLATSTAAGRSPVAGLAEISSGTGPLARELGVLVAETSSGFPQREALAGLRTRVPIREVAALSGLIERSSRYGSPLADQLSDQASALRGAQRRRIEEEAARAAPKIQLAVALLLVPSVLLMIAAGLLANLDRFLAGL
jgi:tight adherence protein C